MTPRATDARLRILADLMLLGPKPKGNADDVIDMYLKAISEFDDIDIEAGQLLLLRGCVPSYQGAYRPGPPQLAVACRMAQAQRLEHERRVTAPRGTSLSPDVEKSPESKMRVGQYLETGNRNALVA